MPDRDTEHTTGEHTPIRAFRCPDEIWFAARDKARTDGRTLSDVLRTLLECWLEDERFMSPTPVDRA